MFACQFVRFRMGRDTTVQSGRGWEQVGSTVPSRAVDKYVLERLGFYSHCF